MLHLQLLFMTRYISSFKLLFPCWMSWIAHEDTWYYLLPVHCLNEYKHENEFKHIFLHSQLRAKYFSRNVLKIVLEKRICFKI